MARNTGISISVVGAALASLLLATAPVRAASDLCEELETRLAAAETSGGDNRTARFDHAIDVQQGELRKARDEARIARCDFEMAGDAVARCASINSQVAEMERNLLDLQRERSALVGRDVSGSERSRLLGMIETHGCDRTEQASDSGSPPRVIDGRNGLEIRQGDPAAAGGGDPNHIVLLPHVSVDPNGSYRTMCVRTCDGYYFPISYAVTPAQFSADEAACAARCPGAAVQLYFHRVPEEEPEDMVSAATGAPYTELPSAFLYRRPNHGHVRSCTCQAAHRGSFSIIAGTPPDEGEATGLSDGWGDGGSIVTLPLPAPGERDALPVTEEPAPKPATTEPGQGSQAAATNEGNEPEKAEAPERPMPDRPVRVVGPKFFPDPSKAIILRDPDPTGGR